MLLIKLKSKVGSEVIKVLAIRLDKMKTHYNIELAAATDEKKLELAGFEPDFETLTLSSDEFVDHVQSIEVVG